MKKKERRKARENARELLPMFTTLSRTGALDERGARTWGEAYKIAGESVARRLARKRLVNQTGGK